MKWYLEHKENIVIFKQNFQENCPSESNILTHMEHNEAEKLVLLISYLMGPYSAGPNLTPAPLLLLLL